jgi:hypothetical protein
MSFAYSILCRAVSDGLLAQKKLEGDTTIMASDNHEGLQRIVSQGKEAEGVLRQNNQTHFLKQAYARGEVPFAE